MMNSPFRLLFSLCLVCLFGACDATKPETNAERGIREKILYIGNGSEPQTLDPGTSTGLPEYHIQLAIFEGLVTKNNRILTVEPGVAESWTLSDDGLVYRFQLRDNARWSNGDPVVAQDFVDSWRRTLSPAMASQYAYELFHLKNGEAFHRGSLDDFSAVGVKALSPLELEVTLENPTPYFLQLLDHHSYYPVHKASIEKLGDFTDPLNPWTRPEHFVGNGPFTLDVWDVNRAVEVKRNAHYWNQERIHLNRIVYFPIEDKVAEDRAYRAGQIHMTHTPQFSPEKIAVYREKDPMSLRVIASYSTYYYFFNTTRKPYDDVRVRKAFAYAIDRDTLVSAVMKGGEVPAYSIAPHDPAGYQPQQHFTFDVAKAKALLAEAGYPEGKGFPETEILYNNDDVHRKVALAVQQMLKAHLNVNVRLINQEWKVYLGSRETKNYDIARGGWMADYLDPSNFFDTFYSFSGNNHSGWNSPDYDNLLRQASATADQSQRFALFEEANRLMIEEMPLIPLFYYSDVNLVSPVVKGWHDNVMSYNNYRDVELVAPREQ